MLALGAAIAIASTLVVASPAAAVVASVPVGPERVWFVSGNYEASAGFEFGSTTTTLSVTLPPEAVDIGLTTLEYRFFDFTDGVDYPWTAVSVPADTFNVPVPADFYEGVSFGVAYLEIRNPDQLDSDQQLYLAAALSQVDAGVAVSDVSLLRANASSYDVNAVGDTGFHVGRDFFTEERKTAWGEVISVTGDPGFWSTTAENWPNTRISAYISSADLSGDPVSGFFGYQGEVEWEVVDAGATLQVALPLTMPADVDWSTGSTLTLEVVETYTSSFGGVPEERTGGINIVTVPVNFFPTSRLSGYNRFATAAAVAAQFEFADTAYIANGRNYPDALSAAPAAAHFRGVLLLADQDSLPPETAGELLRLKPDLIVIAGGTAAVSDSVKAQIEALYPGTQVRRDSGADRYATSRVISERAFGAGGAENAFIATGANFPDALAASAAAAYVNAPVVLVPGSSSAVDAATLATLSNLETNSVYIAGGTAVVSTGIQSQLKGVFGAGSVTRLSGTDRYQTAVTINNAIFPVGTTKAYLAVGTGFADALAGAALAGANSAPLYTVQGNCVPQTVLDSMNAKGVTDITLLGGTAVLTLPVAKLVRC